MASFIPRFLRHLRDVVITAPSDGEALLYDISDGKWKNAAAGGSGDLSDAVILTPAASARNVIQPTAGTVIASIVKAHAAQSVDLMQWQKSDGTPLVAISESGNVTAVAITAKDGTSTPLYVTRDTNSGAFAAFETEDALYSVELGTPGVAIFGDGTQAMLDVSGPTKDGILKVLQGVEGVVHVDGLLVVNSIATPVDATLLASELGMWFDPTNGAAKVMFKGKTANGTVVTWTIPNGTILISGGVSGADITSGTVADARIDAAIARDSEVAAAYVANALYDANTILAADSDNTPAALTMGASTILARLAAGNIKAASVAEVNTLLGTPPGSASYVTTATEAGLSGEKVLGTDVVMSGTLAARPAAAVAGYLYFATNVAGGTLYRDTGAAWVQIASGLNGRMPPALVCFGGHPAPALSQGSGIGNANRLRGHRVIVPKTGTLVDLYVYIGVQSGNIEAGVLDTTVTTRNRLWTTGSIACPAAGWQKMGDPNLAVTEGDQLDFYCGSDNGTAQFVRCISIVTAASSALPTAFFVSPLGGKPTMTWEGPAATFPLGATVTEANLTATANAFSVFARVS